MMQFILLRQALTTSTLLQRTLLQFRQCDVPGMNDNNKRSIISILLDIMRTTSPPRSFPTATADTSN